MIGFAGLALLTAYAGMSYGSAYRPDVPPATVRSLEAINATTGLPATTQNLVSGALADRDAALAAYRAAGPNADPLSKPEYIVVWAGKMIAADVTGGQLTGYVSSGTVRPEEMARLAAIGMKPGLDAMVVIDARRHNADGTPSLSYGRIVNFVQVPAPFGVEGEPHHMQYEWHDGEPLVAGGLFNDVTTVWDVSGIPEVTLSNVIRPEETPQGTVPDAYDFLPDGRAVGTYMGGPDINYAGSPGSVVVLRPDRARGLVFDSETPAGTPGAIHASNAGGVPEPCSPVEAEPVGTCANPHGIQIRGDLGRMVTADYAEPRDLVTDPAKPDKPAIFRPTVRIWDVSNPARPRLVSVAHMPEGPKASREGHGNIAIMEAAKTHAPAKGMFTGASCGGGIFFTPDVTALKGDSSAAWNEVFDDDMAIFHAPGDTHAAERHRERGDCVGGSWHQVSADNHFLFRTVMGRNPGSTDSLDRGSAKLIYSLDISPLIASAADGHIDCKIDTVAEIARGQGDEADCPRLVSVLFVEDTSTGGPHWGAIDNHSLTPTGAPTRLVFSDSFVARTGVDGNHRLYLVDVDPATGVLTYDQAFRDTETGSLGVEFNRRFWPNHPDAGFYKPHAMVWVCPPGVCPG
ncbi:MAG TPA: hypothetical protein VHL53_09205 [Acidimicrobiia bacterium]|nr:hypothetical protein [Acidimicrobiia bacterium]